MKLDMTVGEIEDAIEHIKVCKGDSEIAHQLEDHLRERFIRHVAADAEQPLARMARLVLTTSDLDFHRWYACARGAMTMDSYHCYEVSKDGRTLDRSVQVLRFRGCPLDRVALDAAEGFTEDDGPTLDWTTTIRIRVEPTDGREPATFEVVVHWERNFRAEAKLVPSSVPS